MTNRHLDLDDKVLYTLVLDMDKNKQDMDKNKQDMYNSNDSYSDKQLNDSNGSNDSSGRHSDEQLNNDAKVARTILWCCSILIILCVIVLLMTNNCTGRRLVSNHAIEIPDLSVTSTSGYGYRFVRM